MSECEHAREVDTDLAADTDVCRDCVDAGDTWVRLDVCKTCGYVGCCDSSKNKHARRHHHETGHPIVGPVDGDWLWCYPHSSYVEPDGSLR
jgi:CPA2 family monovalent cation:H+ antiporter-2